jgi:hypothetical protein
MFFTSCSGAFFHKKKQFKYSENNNYVGTVKWPNNLIVPRYKRFEAADVSIKKGSLKLFGRRKLKAELISQFSLLEIQNESFASENNYIKVKLNLIKSLSFKEFNVLKEYQRRESYEIFVRHGEVEINATDVKGFSNALATLDFEMSKQKNQFEFKSISDWPDINQRILQIELKAMDPEVVCYYLHRAWRMHYNTILFCMHNSVKLNSISLYTEDWAMEKEDFKQIVDYSRSLGFEVIPQFSFLSHQKKEFIDQSISPELMFNELTLDPSNEKVYDLIFSTIDEIDSLISPKIIHIGHDEVMGYLEKQRKVYGPMLPANSFLKNVRTINAYLRSKDIETWMWGDMLLNPETFQDMHNSSLNATSSYEKIIDSIPRDVVIADWHYMHHKWRKKKPLSFPSANYFKNKGFKVVGTTWIDRDVIEQFSSSIYKLGLPEESAMISTVWHELLNGSVKKIHQGDSLKVFDKILQNSGEIFWNIPK